MPNSMRTYELVAFTRQTLELNEESDFSRIENRIRSIFTTIANYAYDAVIEPGDTGEIPGDDEEDIRCIIFDEYKKEGQPFQINRTNHGLLLVIEVFPSEIEYAREYGSSKLLDLLKAKGHYPYSDLNREPVV